MSDLEKLVEQAERAIAESPTKMTEITTMVTATIQVELLKGCLFQLTRIADTLEKNFIYSSPRSEEPIKSNSGENKS